MRECWESTACVSNHLQPSVRSYVPRHCEGTNKALSTGLENVCTLGADTPPELCELFCSMHNGYHDGAGDTFLTLLDRCEELMQDWDLHVNRPNGTGLTTKNAHYDQYLEKFIFGDKQALGWGTLSTTPKRLPC